MASSSSSSRKGWTYDVFLSFRGEDTRNNFVDHLYAALILKGIQTFKDDKMLGGGQPISQELVKAIQESRFCVVVFSKNYANSSWCLEELSKIMECHHQMGLKVLPVFYHVDPSDVRKQTGDFATAFETHENKFMGEMDKVNKWREALTGAANLSGQHILPHNGGEAAFISKIVQEILANIQPRGASRESHLVGIESRIDVLISLLKMEATEEVCIVGIWGMGGIGKTTIARALFNRISYMFEGSSFVADVRENSSDICRLQEQILSNILGERQGYKIQDMYHGAEIIQERCFSKKVLLVLDDVDDVKQLEFLAATHEWFGPGSRIIITTRDQHLLSYANVNDEYKPALLSTDQALELFSRHAFRKSSPPDGYMDLTNRAINYTHRLPLALKVLGSFLCGREAGVWGSALDTLARTQSGEVFDTLKLSFDHLNVFEKQIFLDIACFYKGHDVQRVTRMLDSIIGISVLVEKSLIIISSDNRLDMHDLIQQMGWKLVQESAPNSRLWQHEKIHDLIGKSKNSFRSWLWHLEKMLELIRKTPKNSELEVIEGIVVPREKFDEQDFCFGPHVFESMKKLRILDVNNYFTWFKPSVLPDELRWLTWYEYPFSSLPITDMSKLVGLEMELATVKYLWKGKEMMLQNLKFIHLERCVYLTRFPDVSGAPNIEELILSHCSRMVEVDDSVGSLKMLIHLDMSGCIELKSLPSVLQMESLETLNLSCCMSLERIPEFSPCMVNLSHSDISWCRQLRELPSSIKNLSNLSFLNLDHCISLKSIPNSICELKCLTTLGLLSCGKLPDEFKSIEYLEELRIDYTNFHVLINFGSLRKLCLGEFGDNDFPNNINGLSSLKELRIRSNYVLIKFPESISHLSGLKHVEVYNCSKLQTIHGLPSGIQVLMATYCDSLEKIEDLSKEYRGLSKIHIYKCPKLIEDEDNERYLEKMLHQSFLEKWVAADRCLSINIPRSTIYGSNIPYWFKAQHNGHQVALKLPPGWQTDIAGLAMCFVSWGEREFEVIGFEEIRLRFENGGMFFPKSNDENINGIEKDTKVRIWIGYIPFSLFEELHEDNNDEWFHMTGGYLVFEFLKEYGDVKRCGAQIVYKEDVASIQHTIPSLSSYYWTWKLTRSINCIVFKIDQFPYRHTG